MSERRERVWIGRERPRPHVMPETGSKRFPAVTIRIAATGVGECCLRAPASRLAGWLPAMALRERSRCNATEWGVGNNLANQRSSPSSRHPDGFNLQHYFQITPKNQLVIIVY